MEKQYKKLVKILNDNNLTKVSFEDKGKKYVVERTAVVQGSEAAMNTATITSQNNVKPVIDGTAINSPIVGTFYESEGPGKKAFVKKGDKVKKGQVIFIIEAMKVMNEVKSTVDGVVKEILYKDSELVEYDQPVMIIG